MTVLRIQKKESNFLILDKTCLNERVLSWGAKGLHSYLMSLPPNWQINVYDLVKRAKNGRDAVRGLINELHSAGYITKEFLRDIGTGKYSRLEYVVHEKSQKIIEKTNIDATSIPGPENPSSDSPSTEKPAPENPSSNYPSPENPTQIYINNNKYINNKLLLAAVSEEPKHNSSAAELYLNKKFSSQYSFTESSSKIMPLFPEDSLIDDVLTPNQLKKISDVVEKLKLPDGKKIQEEIEYCLLSKIHFKGCGKDFVKKLNSIRAVIIRGDWQTPAELVIGAKEKVLSDTHQLKLQLHEARTEERHFHQLLRNAQGQIKHSLETIIAGVQIKIQQLEGNLKSL